MTRISERDLILPALFVIKVYGEVNTSVLISELIDIFKPTGEDAEILKDRTDTKFSQIARNLVSHHKIDQEGLGYTEFSDRIHKITKTGLEYLEENIEAVEYLIENGFEYGDMVRGANYIDKGKSDKKGIETFDENIVITEGIKTTRKATNYTRSNRLRNAAIHHYQNREGRILCSVCGFDFRNIYGELGEGFIEIHHIKPIIKYSDEEYDKFLPDALKNLRPLCSNCHRMVHRDKSAAISIDELKRLLEKGK